MTTAPIEDLIPLPHLPRELIQLVEPGQDIVGARRLYAMVSNGELPMIIYHRGRWKLPRPEMPALAQALGLRLKRSSRPRSGATRPSSRRSRRAA